MGGKSEDTKIACCNGCQLKEPVTKIVLKTTQSPGDALVMSAAIESLMKLHPGKYQVGVETPAMAIWENNPHVLNDVSIRSGATLIPMHYPLVHQSNQVKVHFMRGYCDYLGSVLGINLPLAVDRPALYLSDVEKNDKPIEGKYVVINAGVKSDYTTKQYPHYQKVVDLLRNKVQFVQVGEIPTGGDLQHFHKPLDGVIDMIGKTDVRQLIQLAHHSVGGIGPVTFLTHIMAALRKPYVCLKGGQEPYHWVHYEGQATFHGVGEKDVCYTGGSEFGGCWKSRVLPLSDGDSKNQSLCVLPVLSDPPSPKCLHDIAPETVVDALEQIIMPKISIGFHHGLGDSANVAHVLNLYVRYGFNVDVECGLDKAPLFKAAGCNIIDKAKVRHSWPHASTYDLTHTNAFAVNKTGHNLSLPPLPDIGLAGDLWPELRDIKLSLDSQVVPEIRDVIDRFINGMSKPLVLFHPMGNSLAGTKNLSKTQTQEICHKLVEETQATLVILDWNNKTPKITNNRIKYVHEDLPNLSVPGLFHLMSKSDLIVGVDSGPLHLAKFTKTPTVGVWTHHYPSHVVLPRRETLNLVSPIHKSDRYHRAEFNTILCQLSTDAIVEHTKRMLAKTKYLVIPAEDVQLQHLVGLTAGQFRDDSGHDIDRHVSFDLALKHLASKIDPVMVETGTIHSEEDWAGAGFSTYLFGLFLQHHGGSLHSVDNDKGHVEFAGKWTAEFPCVKVHEQHSHDFLKSWLGPPIDLFYSDSADTGTDGYQECCLGEVQLIQQHLTHDAVILIDDTPPENPKGSWQGNGSLAVPWLLDNGWETIHSGWQVLLKRKT